MRTYIHTHTNGMYILQCSNDDLEGQGETFGEKPTYLNHIDSSLWSVTHDRSSQTRQLQ